MFFAQERRHIRLEPLGKDMVTGGGRRKLREQRLADLLSGAAQLPIGNGMVFHSAPSFSRMARKADFVRVSSFCAAAGVMPRSAAASRVE